MALTAGLGATLAPLGLPKPPWAPVKCQPLTLQGGNLPSEAAQAFGYTQGKSEGGGSIACCS